MRALLAIIITFILTDLQSQNLVTKRFFQPLYAFDLISSENVLKQEASSFSKEDLQLCQIHLNWWKLISGYSEQKDFLETSNELIETYINQLESYRTDSVSNEILLRLLNGYTFRSRVQLLDDNYFSGLKDLRKCILLLEELNERQYKADELKLVNALYNYYHDFAYQNYYLLRPILMGYPDGNMTKGLDSLKELAQQSNWAVSAESTYFLAKIYLESEEDPSESMKYCKILLKEFPNNIIYSIKYAKALKAAEMETEFLEYCRNQAFDANNMHGISEVSQKHFNQLFTKMIEEY